MSGLDSCSYPIICTQEAVAYLETFQSLSIEMRPWHNDINALILGNPSTLNDLKYYIMYTFEPIDVLDIFDPSTYLAWPMPSRSQEMCQGPQSQERELP